MTTNPHIPTRLLEGDTSHLSQDDEPTSNEIERLIERDRQEAMMNDERFDELFNL